MHRYENAYVGISRVYSAVLLELIVAILAFVGGLVKFIPILNIIYIITAFVILILRIISFVFMLTGLSRAGKDNGKFKVAFLWVIITFILGIVISILTILMPAFSIVANIFTIINSVTNLLVILLVVTGIADLVPQLSGRSKTIITLVIVNVVLGIVAMIPNPIVSVICAVAVLIISIVYFVMYLSLLGAAKKQMP